MFCSQLMYQNIYHHHEYHQKDEEEGDDDAQVRGVVGSSLSNVGGTGRAEVGGLRWGPGPTVSSNRGKNKEKDEQETAADGRGDAQALTS